MRRGAGGALPVRSRGCPCVGRGRVPSSRGYTLVELVVVIAILGIVSAISVPALGRLTAEAPADAAVSAAVKLLGRARATALERATPVTLSLDRRSGRYTVEADGGELTSGRIALGDVVAYDTVAVLLRFRFLASGAAEADTLRIAAAGEARTVVVDPWTGVAHVVR